MRCPVLTELPPPPPGKSGWPWSEESPADTVNMSEGKAWPRISIITPSYNHAQFLEETIRSVLLQGYPNLEYFVMDGGSSDNSVEIIRKYEPWIAGWVSEKDQGQSDAINKGLLRSSGSLLAWLNSDDYYLPNCLLKTAMSFAKHPEAGMIYSNIQIIDEHGRFIYIPSWKPYNFKDQLTQRMGIVQPAAFWRREVMDRIGILRTDLHIVMDYEYWIRMGRFYRIVGRKEPLAAFRMTPVTKTGSQGYGRGPEFIKILDDLYAESDVAPEILSVKRKAYAGAYLYGAEGFFMTDVVKARAWLLKAVSCDRYILRSVGWRMYFKIFFGRRIYVWCRSIQYKLKQYMETIKGRGIL